MDGSRGEIARMSWKKSTVGIKRDIGETVILNESIDEKSKRPSCLSVIYNEIVDKRKRNQ